MSSILGRLVLVAELLVFSPELLLALAAPELLALAPEPLLDLDPELI
jgi:hypothetical protein